MIQPTPSYFTVLIIATWYPLWTYTMSTYHRNTQLFKYFDWLKIGFWISQPDHSAGPLEKVYMDLYGPLPGVPRYNSLQILPGRREGPSKQEEMKYILTLEDDWSRFVDLIPITAKDVGSVASGLLANLSVGLAFQENCTLTRGKNSATKYSWH